MPLVDFNINQICESKSAILGLSVQSKISKKIWNYKNEHPESVIDDIVSDDEKYAMAFFRHVSSMVECVSSIDKAIGYMENSYGKEELNMTDDEYLMYHYDVFCYKISTLKDLYFKLVNHVYGLNLQDKAINWKNIEKNKDNIANQRLFDLLEDNNTYLDSVYAKRNKSAHQGEINHSALADYQTYRLAFSVKGLNGEDDLKIERYIDKMLTDGKEKIMNEVDVHRHNVYTFTLLILCSIYDDYVDHFGEIFKKEYKSCFTAANKTTRKEGCSCPLLMLCK